MKDIVRSLLNEEKELKKYISKRYETNQSRPWKGYHDYIIEIKAEDATKKDIEEIIKENGWDQLAFPYQGGELSYNDDKDVWEYHYECDSGD